MGSVFMPVDKCTRENSCLQVGQHGDGDDDDGVDNDGPVDGDDNDDYHDSQVLAGSHLMGRVDHFLMGEQSGADPERVRLTRINHYDNCNSIKKNTGVHFSLGVLPMGADQRSCAHKCVC